MVLHVCLSVCPCQCCGQQNGLRAEPIPSGVRRSFTCSTVDTSAPRRRTLDGGTFVPSVSRSPGVTPRKKAGRPMGPSTPRCSASKSFGSVSFSWPPLRFCFGLVPWLVLWGLSGMETLALQDQPLSALMWRPPLVFLSLSLPLSLIFFFSLSCLFGCFLKRDSSGITG